MVPRDPAYRRQVWLGIGILGLGHLAQLVWILTGLERVYPSDRWIFLVMFWLIQVVYLLPAVIVVAILRRWAVLQGLLLGAGLTALINFGVCGAASALGW